MSAKTDEALPEFKLITPLIPLDKYNSSGENRAYTLYGKMYFWDCINNYTELKSGGMFHVSILVFSFSSLRNKVTGKFDLLMFTSEKRFICIPYMPPLKIIFHNK